MKLIPFELNGSTFHLLLNAAALFDIYAQFGADGSILDHIKENDSDGFEATCWYLDKLAEQGELYRRWEGQTSQAMPKEGLFRLCLTPYDLPRAKTAIKAAVAWGFLREEAKAPKEVDLGLLELEKKTGES